MDFEFSSEQELFRESVRRLLRDRGDLALVRRSYDLPAADADDSDDVWRALVELGALGLLVPEEHGGAGLGMIDAAVVLEELGRAVSPLPYLSSAIGAVSLVLAAGSPREHTFLLPGLADGTTVGTIALYEPDRRYSWSTPLT